MSVYEALVLMIAFATLVLLINDGKKQKITIYHNFDELVDGYSIYYCYRLKADLY